MPVDEDKVDGAEEPDPSRECKVVDPLDVELEEEEDAALDKSVIWRLSKLFSLVSSCTDFRSALFSDFISLTYLILLCC